MAAEPGCDIPWRAPQEQVSERICEQIVDVQMVEQLVKLLNTESQDRIQQRTAEQIVNTSVPQVAEGLVGVFKFFSQDRIQRFEKRTVEIPQPQIIEKIDETPEIQTAQEHSAVLAQLASRISGIMMKVGAATGEDPFAKVKSLISDRTWSLMLALVRICS